MKQIIFSSSQLDYLISFLGDRSSVLNLKINKLESLKMKTVASFTSDELEMVESILKLLV